MNQKKKKKKFAYFSKKKKMEKLEKNEIKEIEETITYSKKNIQNFGILVLHFFFV